MPSALEDGLISISLSSPDGMLEWFVSALREHGLPDGTLSIELMQSLTSTVPGMIRCPAAAALDVLTDWGPR